MVNRDPTVDVLCVESFQDSQLRTRLSEHLDSLHVSTVEESTAVASPQLVDQECDCIVVAVGESGASVETIPTLSERSTPLVAFISPDAETGTATTALELGATDVVTAAGPDRYEVLAHRVQTAVEQRETTDSFHNLKARFEALANTPSLAVVTIDGTSTVQYASPGIEELFGYTADNLVGNSLTQIMPDRLEEPHYEAVSEYLNTGERSLDWDWTELPAQHQDGTEFPIAVTFGERTGEDGNLFSAIIRDITERKERQQRLDTLATAVDQTMDGVGILDEDGQFTYANDAHANIYGYDDPDALIGEDWRMLYDEDEQARFEDEILPEVTDDGVWRGEATGMRADGSQFGQDVSLTHLEDEGLICVVRDISDRIQRRRELRNERQFVDSVMDALPDAFYVLDADGSFSRWNEAMCKMSGYTDEELDGKHATELIPDEDRELVTKAMASVVRDRESQTVQSELLTKQGERIPYEFSGSPIVNADDELRGLAGIGRNTSTKRFREKQLSVLSRVLRHNVRNRTSVIKGNTWYVRTRIDDPELSEKLQAINAAADDLNAASTRARRAERLLRGEESSRCPVELVDVLYDVLETTDTRDATVQIDVPDTATALTVGTDMTRRVLKESLQNAVEHNSEPTVDVAIEADEETVTVHISDDGCGIPKQERDVILAGEETDLAHSTGLGLWLVDWITSLSGGSLRFEESDLGGTAVVLTFPAA